MRSATLTATELCRLSLGWRLEQKLMPNQISGRLHEAVKDEFSAYAARFDLDDSQLAKLLFRREQHHRQLAGLVASGRKPEVTAPPRRRRPATITAHYRSAAAITEFDAYAQSCGLARNRAAAWIIEHELKERWLESSFLRSPGWCETGA